MRTCLGGRLGHCRRADPVPQFPDWGFYTSFKGQTPGRFTVKDGQVYVLLKVQHGVGNTLGRPRLPELTMSMDHAGFALYRWNHDYDETWPAGAVADTTQQLLQRFRTPNENVRLIRWKHNWEWVRSYDPPGRPQLWLPKVLDHLEADWPKGGSP